MEQVLQDFNLKAYTKTFIDEKIMPDIVCKLSSHEMEALGVSSRADMMRLRTECVKYGTDKPQRVESQYQARRRGSRSFIDEKLD